MNARPNDPLTLLARSWFPLCLLLLLLLALPGMILLALYVLGLDPPVNNWLRERWGVTYQVAIPSEHWWAVVLLLLTPFLLVLLYFLKLRRRPLAVPSTFLWKKSIEDLHVNSLFQWLRENVLLLLQLLVVLFLIYAIIDVHFHGRERVGNHYILLLDNSASMSATDVRPSRLEKAKEEAVREIDNRRDQDFGMVIVFNSGAEILQSYTNDKNLLRRAVQGVAPTQRTTRIDEALGLADSLANPHRGASDEARAAAGRNLEAVPTEVHVFSDGRFRDVPEFAIDNLRLILHPVGQPGAEAVDNVGIVSFNAVRDDKDDPGRLRVFVRVLNYRRQPVEARVRLWVEKDGERQDEPFTEPVAMAGRDSAPAEPGKDQAAARDNPGEGVATFTLENVDERARVVLRAELVDLKDHFPLDNEAWLAVGVVRRARVLLVGPPDDVTSPFKPLGAFFGPKAAPTHAVAAVSYLAPKDLEDSDKYRKPAREGQFDLVIFDRCAPAKEEDLPQANTFFIGAVPPPFRKADMPRLESPQIKGWMSRHPLMRYLSAVPAIGIAEAFRFDLKDPRVPPRTPRLIEADRDTALMFTLGRQSYTDVVMAFPLLDDDGNYVTNWGWQPSFPLFLRNLLYTLGHVVDSSGEENVQPGEVKVLRPDVAVKAIEVTDPAGHTERLERGTRAEFAFGKTERVGPYLVKWDGQPQRNFAVNLLDPAESNLEPRQAVGIGIERVGSEESRNQPRSTWKWVVVAALLLILLEWYIYNRRVYV